MSSLNHPALNWPQPGLRTPTMVPSARTNTTSMSMSKPRPILEIIPDNKFIVFHGGEHEAASVKLTGVVRFTTPESMSIMRPRVRLEGKRKISWLHLGGMSAGETLEKRVFWNQEKRLGIESSHKVKAGSIEWPFEFELAPSLPESVEGLKETYIVYHLHASVTRSGWNTKDLVAQEHIRIVRTLGQESMDMTRSRVNADIWANKISYSISIPTDAIVFGTSLTADVELSPIKKGLRLGKVELRLMETVVKRIQVAELPDSRGDRSRSEETEVAKAEMDFPEDSRILYNDETLEDPTMADEMYKFKATLPLPKSLNTCRQDVDAHQINITHRFKLMVNIHNPEGHISQLVCRLPVKLFISPNLPVDDRNEVCPGLNGVSEEDLNSVETTAVAPPEYGRHQLDQIYSDIDPAGYMSRAGSAPGTPADLLSLSRRVSQDNLASLNGAADADTSITNGDRHGSATPSVLHSRLVDLQAQDSIVPNGQMGSIATHSVSGGNSPDTGLFDGINSTSPANRRIAPSAYTNGYHHNISRSRSSPEHSSEPSGRTSDDDDAADPLVQRDYNMDHLSRVPSYGAALRNPGAVKPFTHGPPSYVEATSRPPSPGLQRPATVHVRSSGASTPASGRGTSQQALATALGILDLSTPSSGGATQRASPLDEEVRLRMLRART